MASTYTAEFKRINTKLNLKEEALLLYFYRRLKDNVKDEISKENRPDNLYEYIATVIKINNRLYER